MTDENDERAMWENFELTIPAKVNEGPTKPLRCLTQLLVVREKQRMLPEFSEDMPWAYELKDPVTDKPSPSFDATESSTGNKS